MLPQFSQRPTPADPDQSDDENANHVDDEPGILLDASPLPRSLIA